MQEHIAPSPGTRGFRFLVCIVATMGIVTVCWVPLAHAACLGVPGTAGGGAFVGSVGTVGPLHSFVGTGCDSSPAGLADSCLVADTAFSLMLVAIWASTGERSGDATGGCTFMCQFGDCFVGNDGLPVELMHFGVE